MSISNSWIVRPAIPQDIPFIYSSWLKSFRYDSTIGNSLRSSIFYEQYREVIDHILQKSLILIACLPDDDSIILGYLVCEPELEILHYCFIKESFRQLGIATDLINLSNLSKFRIQYTHQTKSFKQFKFKSIVNPEYNPFLLYSR